MQHSEFADAFLIMTDTVSRMQWLLSQNANGSAETPDTSMAVASVQMAGTFGGATASVEVSNDGVNWVPLEDREGNVVSATAAAFFEISTGAAHVRAKATGGNGTTALVISLVAWRG